MPKKVLVNTEADQDHSFLMLPWPTLDPEQFANVAEPLLRGISRAKYSFAICVRDEVADRVGSELMEKHAPFFTWKPAFVQGVPDEQLTAAEFFWIYIIEALHRTESRLLDLFKAGQVSLTPHRDEQHSQLTLAWTVAHELENLVPAAAATPS